MNDSTNFNNYNNINNFTMNRGYVPCMDYYQLEFPINNPTSFNLNPNIINTYNTQSTNISKETEKSNNLIKIETDSELIQDLTGNYLEESNEENNSDEKIDKKEIKIFLGNIIVENDFLKYFPLINLKNEDKYYINVPENILNKGEFFTAIKDEKEEEEKEKEMNEIEMTNEEKDKILVPDNYEIDLDEFLKNKITQFMNKNEIKLCTNNNNRLLLKNIIEILYDKCLNCISEIKRNVKNRVKKIKIINISNELRNLIKFINELLELFILLENKINNIDVNSISIDKKEKDNSTFITYAQSYLQNCGKTFKCEICGKLFVNFQTLGGHMSKIHPNCSEKYKKQNTIRKQREGQRKLLDYVREKLFMKYNLNYRQLKKKDEKEKIKSFIKAHQKEYEILRRKIYREKALKDNE